MTYRRISLVLCTLIFLFVLASPSYAHPGSTDGSGGHYDRSTGEYHYHHGYPAHSHKNGVCPYDYVDKTGQSSGASSSSGTSKVRFTPPPRPTATKRPAEKQDSTASLKKQNQAEIPFVSQIINILCTPFGVFSVLVSFCGLGFGVISLTYERVPRSNSQESAALLNKCVASTDENSEEAWLKDFYRFNTLRELSGMPDNLSMGAELRPSYRAGIDTSKLPPLEMYIVSSSAKCYHCVRCTHAQGAMMVNVYKNRKMLNGKTRCYYCMPGPLPDMKWYDEYLRHLEICKKNGITPKLE